MNTPRKWADYRYYCDDVGNTVQEIVRYHIAPGLKLFVVRAGLTSSAVCPNKYYVAARDKGDASRIFSSMLSWLHTFGAPEEVAQDDAERVLCDPFHGIIL